MLLEEKAKTVQIQFTLEGEGLSTILIFNFFYFFYHGWKVNLDSYKSMALDNWYNLGVRVKSPHNYMVWALGSCVKWPLDKGGNMK